MDPSIHPFLGIGIHRRTLLGSLFSVEEMPDGRCESSCLRLREPYLDDLDIRQGIMHPDLVEEILIVKPILDMSLNHLAIDEMADACFFGIDARHHSLFQMKIEAHSQPSDQPFMLQESRHSRIRIRKPADLASRQFPEDIFIRIRRFVVEF